MTDGGHLFHFLFDIIPVMHLRFADMDGVVDLVAAVLDGLLAFEQLAFKTGLSEREGDGGADMHVCAFQPFLARNGPCGIDGDHGRIKGSCFVAQFFHFLVGSVRFQIRVIKIFRKFVFSFW